ncbi:MAG: efflux RND transporter permease subunit [Lachnospiraceae bacterium]|jgi:multidrug efflux pump subunit AcrB
MLSRYSVKKPYTVVVAVVLIIILGVVSFTKMHTDLFPSMNLPYAVVITTYPGASPEAVEETVTKPIEESMATVSNIQNVMSTSASNMSMVVLEFAEDANMDSVTIEMRESLDQISSFWDDSVGDPIIMKLNPDMMPIMVAAVENGDMDSAELSTFVSRNVEAEVESIDGVASVTPVGGVTERVDVIIRQEKLDEVNAKVRAAVSGEFEEAEQELADAQAEVDNGKNQIASGKAGLAAGQNQLNEGKAQADSEFGKAGAAMDTALAELEEHEKALDYDKNSALLKQGIAQCAQIKELLEGCLKGLQAPAAIQSQMDEQQAIVDNPASSADEVAAAQQTIVLLQQQLAAANENAAAIQTQANGILSQLRSQGMAAGSIEEAMDSLETSIQELETQQSTLDEAKANIDAGKAEIQKGASDLEIQKRLASVEMSMAQIKIDSGSSQLASAEQQLNSAEEQLDSGREQLKETKETTLDNADLHGILTSEMVKGILTAENFSMPAGYVTEDGVDYLVKVGEEVKETSDLADLVILDMGIDGLDPIRLSDVADVIVTDDSDEVYARLNGKPGVVLSIEKQTGYSTGDVTDRILEKFDQLETEYEDFQVSVLMNQGIYIDMVVDSVLHNLLYGAILAILILFFFLKDIRPTFVIACSIPISVVTAIVLMYFSGVTLNVISLSGLALGVGMLVDNSIVVIENIYRKRNEGVPAKKAAIEGAQQVAGAIMASTLTTICVFVPIVFTEGITRQLFVDMGLTIGYSLAASLAIALTLVPMMSAGLLRNTQTKQTKLLESIRNQYAKLIEKALRHKVIVIVGALVLFGLSMVWSLSKGTAFMPDMESTQATITVTTDKDALFEETTEKADEVIAAIEDLEDIETIGAMAGGSMISGMTEGSTNSITMYLVLKEEDRKMSGEELEKEILHRTEDIEGCEVALSMSSMDMSALGGSGIQIQIKGKDLDTLQKISTDVAEIVSQVEGTENVDDGMQEADEEYRIQVDKAKAMEYKLTVAQVFQEIYAKVAEATSATTISTDTKDYEVYVRNEADEQLTRDGIKNMTITVTNSENEEEEIRIGDIASFEDAKTPQSINRDAQQRYMQVTAGVDSSHNIGLVSADVKAELDKYVAPEGYTLEMAGEDVSINEAMEQLMLMLSLAILFIYLIMVAQFQSLLSPFIIMFTIPLAFTGGFLGLAITGQEFSVIAMVGFVMLSGIIVNNGIVMVDYINQLRREGMEKREAIIEAGKARLRPIVMTALTTILGLTTMAMGLGMGGDMVQPMAIVTIGGLLYGTLLTLFIVPCVYDILNRKKHYRKDEVRLQDEEER